MIPEGIFFTLSIELSCIICYNDDKSSWKGSGLLKRFLRRVILLMTAVTISALYTFCALLPADCAPQHAKAAEPLFGIDVSKFQEEIDWKAVAEGGVRFAILRCSKVIHAYDDWEQDSAFETNYAGARAAGIAVGCYMYTDAATASEFIQDVDYMLQVLNGKSFEFPVFLDLESASRQEHLPPDVFMPALLAGLERIEEAGFTAGVYSSSAFYSECIDRKQLMDENYAIWEANYFNSVKGLPSPAGHDLSAEATIWQYSGCGKTPGIRTTVDCNICYTDQFFSHYAALSNSMLPDGALREGAGFSVTGTLSCKSVLRSITGEIFFAKNPENPLQSVTVNPNARKYKLTGFFTKKLNFSELECGDYRLRISAVDSSGTDITVAESWFAVTKDGMPLATATTVTSHTETEPDSAVITAESSTESSLQNRTHADRPTRKRKSRSFAGWWLGMFSSIWEHLPGRWLFSGAASLTLRLSLERTPLHRIFVRLSTVAEISYLASGIGKEIL